MNTAGHPRLRKIRKRPEQSLQRAVAAYLDVALPPRAIWWHTPNGGARSRTEAAILKGMGVKAGFPDISIAWDGRLYCIELKAPGGRTSVAQEICHGRLGQAGVPVSLCSSLDSVAGCLQMWRIPLRGMPA